MLALRGEQLRYRDRLLEMQHAAWRRDGRRSDAGRCRSAGIQHASCFRVYAVGPGFRGTHRLSASNGRCQRGRESIDGEPRRLLAGNPDAYFGLPIGLAFMMCDDRRRQEVGRICLIWSLISGVIHLLFFIVAAIGMRQYFAIALNTLRGQIQHQQGLGGGGDLGM